MIPDLSLWCCRPAGQPFMRWGRHAFIACQLMQLMLIHSFVFTLAYLYLNIPEIYNNWCSVKPFVGPPNKQLLRR
jgi:hypothetical protein